MAPKAEIIPSAKFREELRKRGGETAARCYQCATCSSVCMLAPEKSPFPRQQMLWAQWGLADRLATDPSVWLCHRCNDCSTRCPRDAKPGDVMQVVRALTVQHMAVPGFMGKIVGKASLTWPLLLGLPFLFWVVALYLINGLTVPATAPLVYDQFVPHWLIYTVFFSVTGLVSLVTLASGFRYWKLMGQNGERRGSFVGNLVPALVEIGVHRRFGKCGTEGPKRWGHFTLLWGFVGAALASGLIIVAMYIMKEPLPLPLMHPFKIVGNVSAVLLVIGGVIVLLNRFKIGKTHETTTAYDNFFLALVLLLIATGVLVEVGRFAFSPQVACWLYILHLTTVLSLFATFPYSKFAHMMYRTLAMVHERMAVKS